MPAKDDTGIMQALYAVDRKLPPGVTILILINLGAAIGAAVVYVTGVHWSVGVILATYTPVIALLYADPLNNRGENQ